LLKLVFIFLVGSGKGIYNISSYLSG